MSSSIPFQDENKTNCTYEKDNDVLAGFIDVNSKLEFSQNSERLWQPSDHELLKDFCYLYMN